MSTPLRIASVLFGIGADSIKCVLISFDLREGQVFLRPFDKVWGQDKTDNFLAGNTPNFLRALGKFDNSSTACVEFENVKMLRADIGWEFTSVVLVFFNGMKILVSRKHLKRVVMEMNNVFIRLDAIGGRSGIKE